MRGLELGQSAGARDVSQLPARWLLAIVTAHQATASTFDQGVPVLTPYLQQLLGLSLGFAAVVGTAGNLGRAIASVPIGWLADRLGGRRVLTAAGLVLALLLVAVSLSRTVWVVGCLLVIGGICTASSTPAGSRAIIDAYPARGRAVPLGVRQTGVPIGGLAAGITLPLIAEHGSVRAALLALAATALLGGLLTTALPRHHPAAPPHTDPATGRAPPPSRSLAAIASWGAILVIGQFGFLAFALPYLIHAAGRSSLVAAGAIAIAQTGAVVGRVWWSWLGTEERRRLAHGHTIPDRGHRRLPDGRSRAGHPGLAVVRPHVRIRRHSDGLERPVGGCRGRVGPSEPRGKRSRNGPDAGESRLGAGTLAARCGLLAIRLLPHHVAPARIAARVQLASGPRT
jgi:MFS family permease